MPMTTTTLKDLLYERLLASPLGVHGAEQTLPALENLLREVRSEKFWEGKRPRRLVEEQMIRAWASYRRDIRELRERLRQRQDWDDLLSWLTVFMIDHYRELARTSALEEPSFQLVFSMGWATLTPEDALAMRDDFQTWAVEWLRNALRDEDIDAGLQALGGNQGDGGDDAGPDLRPTPKPAPGNAHGFDF